MFHMRIGWTLLLSSAELTVVATLCAAAVSQTPTVPERNRVREETRAVAASDARELPFTLTSAARPANIRMPAVGDSSSVPQRVPASSARLLLFVLLGLAAAVAALSVRMACQSPDTTATTQRTH
jgi:hypothetical protein